MVSFGSELGAHSQKLAFGGESRIRTCEARSAADLQSAAINHSAISPDVDLPPRPGLCIGAQEGTRTPNLPITNRLRGQLRHLGRGPLRPFQGANTKTIRRGGSQLSMGEGLAYRKASG